MTRRKAEKPPVRYYLDRDGHRHKLPEPAPNPERREEETTSQQ